MLGTNSFCLGEFKRENAQPGPVVVVVRVDGEQVEVPWHLVPRSFFAAGSASDRSAVVYEPSQGPLHFFLTKSTPKQYHQRNGPKGDAYNETGNSGILRSLIHIPVTTTFVPM